MVEEEEAEALAGLAKHILYEIMRANIELRKDGGEGGKRRRRREREKDWGKEGERRK